MLIEPRDDSDIYGIMTLKDIARKVIAHSRQLHEAHVYEIMSKPVYLSLPICPFLLRLGFSQTALFHTLWSSKITRSQEWSL